MADERVPGLRHTVDAFAVCVHDVAALARVLVRAPRDVGSVRFAVWSG